MKLRKLCAIKRHTRPCLVPTILLRNHSLTQDHQMFPHASITHSYCTPAIQITYLDITHAATAVRESEVKRIYKVHDWSCVKASDGWSLLT